MKAFYIIENDNEVVAEGVETTNHIIFVFWFQQDADPTKLNYKVDAMGSMDILVKHLKELTEAEDSDVWDYEIVVSDQYWNPYMDFVDKEYDKAMTQARETRQRQSARAFELADRNKAGE